LFFIPKPIPFAVQIFFFNYHYYNILVRSLSGRFLQNACCNLRVSLLVNSMHANLHSRNANRNDHTSDKITCQMKNTFYRWSVSAKGCTINCYHCYNSYAPRIIHNNIDINIHISSKICNSLYSLHHHMKILNKTFFYTINRISISAPLFSYHIASWLWY